MTAPEQTLYFRFNRFLERHTPRGLYKRALLILIVPIIIIQLITTGIFLDRHWDQMTKVLGRGLSNEVALIVELYEKSDRSAATIKTLQSHARGLRLTMSVLREKNLPAQEQFPFWRLFDSKMQKYLARETGKPFWIDSNAGDGNVEIRVEVEKGMIFQFLADEERAYAASTPLLVGLMLLSTLLLSTIAVVFLRNQIRPIVDLARAAQSFGLGRDVTGYAPRGAKEVRLAGNAFLDMKRRIARHVEQRTAMLAGVSHDLRTIITRFRLELAVLGNDPKYQPLKDDVDEMQRMLEDYMNFVRGDGDEQTAPVDVETAVKSVVSSIDRGGNGIDVGVLPTTSVQLKPNAFRRLLANVIGNAVRHGSKVQVSGELREERLWIYVDDNGPGIPEDQREHVFKPFVRLDQGRNLDQSGTGLGLAIALDIAHAHGGDIILSDSPMGGLRVSAKFPI
jgi:two-component system, OmpR family, osmolarity sensor histidine kinase EnvZ